VLITVAYPVPEQLRPNVDSNFIFGAVGNGNASLTINSASVPLAKNGAFLAFLPMPKDGVYHIFAQRGNEIDSGKVSYRSARAAATGASDEHAKDAYEAFASPRLMRVIKGSDTLQTGNDVAPGAPTPDGDRRWFFPRRTIVHAIGREGKYYKLELEKGEFAWIADSNLSPIEDRILSPEPGGLTSARQFADVKIPCYYMPFLIASEGSTLRIHLYGLTDKSFPITHDSVFGPQDSLIASIGVEVKKPSEDYTIALTKPLWGYKAFYDGGRLIVRIRRPPAIDRDNPLKGLRIMIDPGHPPGGAIGPTGLTEREANLSIATRLRDQLTAKGATVLLTHSTLDGLVSSYKQVEELDARAALAVAQNVDLMVSVHNNAFPDGTNPFNNYGTTTYYYHPFSNALASQLEAAIVPVTGIPYLGAQHKSLAICRPTWMPCALTESLVMMFPDQEQALRDPQFLDKLAAAHVKGIEDFVRARAQ
jgi:N-acetylmuramoyl-L-alanine amidase